MGGDRTARREENRRFHPAPSNRGGTDAEEQRRGAAKQPPGLGGKHHWWKRLRNTMAWPTPQGDRRRTCRSCRTGGAGPARQHATPAPERQGSIVLRKAPRKLNLRKWKGRSKDSMAELGYLSVDKFIDDVRGR